MDAALTGKWDGMQIKSNANAKVSVAITGIAALGEAGSLKYDGKAGGRQVIGFGSWKVQGGLLQYVIEGSNAPRELANGTSGAVKIREVTENEFLYIDLTDQRTHSAKRVK